MIKAYDSSKVILLVNDMQITGLAEDTPIGFEAAEDGFEYSVGFYKEDVVISETNNDVHTATIILQATSPYVKVLDGYAARNEFVSVYVMNNNEPREKSGGTTARIQRPANRSYAKTSENREYSVVVFDYKIED